MPFSPYFYIVVAEARFGEVENQLRRRHGQHLEKVELLGRVDLDQPNHLSGIKRHYTKLSFHTVQGLMEVRRAIKPAVERNRKKAKLDSTYAASDAKHDSGKYRDFTHYITDIREFDVPYQIRASIDLGYRVGHW